MKLYDRNSLATDCHLSDVPASRVPSLSDVHLVECLRSVVRPYISISEVAINRHQQIAAASFPPPTNANDVHRHALVMWEADRNAVTEANHWSLFTDTGTTYGTWIVASDKSLSKVYVEALRPYHFQESVRNEMIINDTPMEHHKISVVVLCI